MNNLFKHPTKKQFAEIQKRRFEKALQGNKVQDWYFNICKLVFKKN